MDEPKAAKPVAPPVPPPPPAQPSNTKWVTITGPAPGSRWLWIVTILNLVGDALVALALNLWLIVYVALGPGALLLTDVPLLIVLAKFVRSGDRRAAWGAAGYGLLRVVAITIFVTPGYGDPLEAGATITLLAIPSLYVGAAIAAALRVRMVWAVLISLACLVLPPVIQQASISTHWRAQDNIIFTADPNADITSQNATGEAASVVRNAQALDFSKSSFRYYPSGAKTGSAAPTDRLLCKGYKIFDKAGHEQKQVKWPVYQRVDVYLDGSGCVYWVAQASAPLNTKTYDPLTPQQWQQKKADQADLKIALEVVDSLMTQVVDPGSTDGVANPPHTVAYLKKYDLLGQSAQVNQSDIQCAYDAHAWYQGVYLHPTASSSSNGVANATYQLQGRTLTFEITKVSTNGNFPSDNWKVTKFSCS